MRGTRFLQGLANAVLDKTLPRMRRWLEERFGPQAELSHLRVEGERVILEGARLPLGPLIVLRVERAAFVLEPSRRRIVLVALRGELAVEGEGGDHVTAPIELVSTLPKDDAWVSGKLQVTHATWRQTIGEGVHHPLSGTVDVFVSLARWELSDGSFSSAESQVWLSASGPMDAAAGGLDDASFVFRQARAGHLIDGLTALAAHVVDAPPPLPRDARLTGEIRWRQGTIEVESSVATERSRLEVAAKVEGTEVRGGSVRGEVAFVDLAAAGVPEGWSGSLRGDLGVTGTWPAVRVEGPVAIDRLVGAGIELERVQAELRLRDQVVRLRELRGELFGAVMRGEARIPLGEEPWVASLQTVGAGAPLVVGLAALGGVTLAAEDGSRRLPEGLSVTGEVTVTGEGEVAATLALEAEATALMVKVVADTSLRGSVRGRIDTGWLAAGGWIEGPVALGGTLHVDGVLEGTPREPELTARLSARWIMVRGRGEAEQDTWRVPLEELGADLQVDPHGFGLSRFRADLLGGSLRGSWIQRDDDLRSQLVLQDVHLGAIELPAAGHRLAAHVAGVAAGWLELYRGDLGLEGSAEINLERPMYRFLGQAAPMLREAGLSPPPPTGHGPARAQIAIEADGILLRRLDMPILGAPLRAEGTLHGPEGVAITGNVRLEEDYLRSSLLLAVPAVLSGSVDVPFAVRGHPPDVKLEADPKAAFREALAKGKAGIAMTDAMDGIRRAVDDLSGMFARRGDDEPPIDPELEALVDRILADDPDTDRLIDRLLEAGVTSDEIVRVLERRRIRMSGDD